MKCITCGKEISDHAKFCPYCGGKITQPEEPVSSSESTKVEETVDSNSTDKEPVYSDTTDKEPVDSNSTTKESEDSTANFHETTDNTSNSNETTDSNSKETASSTLLIGLLILAGFLGAIALYDFFSLIQTFSYPAPGKIRLFLSILCKVGMIAVLIILAINKNKSKTSTLFLILTGIAALSSAGSIISFIYDIFLGLTSFYFSFIHICLNFAQMLISILCMMLVLSFSYMILKQSGNELNIGNMKQAASSFNNTAQNLATSAASKAKEAASQAANAASQAAQNVSQAAQNASQSASNASSANTNYTENNNSNYGANNMNNTYYNNSNAQNYNVPNGMPLKTDRGLLGYIFLSLITCGIYGYYFIYTVARDVNVACSGDGKSTGGLVQFILLSFITCGIYSLWWQYSLGNRLAENAPRYGMSFTENGTTVLLWYLVGWLLCGLGPIFAMNIIIKNTNSICMAYNRAHGFM